MKRNPMAILCLVLGLILGPGYYIYAKFYSGRPLAEYPLQAQTDGFVPLSVPLPPDPSPLRLILMLEAEHGPTTGRVPRNTYTVKVGHVTGSVTREISLASVTTESSQQTFLNEIARLDAPHGQSVIVEISAQGEPEMRVRSAAVALRGDVVEPSPAILGLGGLLLAAGLALLLL
jgi:hypothetical protein